MQRCSERAFAKCPHRHLCGTIHEATFSDNSDCAEFNRKLESAPTTNLERFRAMDDKEIARFLMAAHDCEVHIPFCQNKEECSDELDNGISPARCIVCMMEWLNKPMEVELWLN